jgi:uncharacterized protein
MPQQVVINGVEFARRSERLSGELPLSALARLEDVVVAAEGSVAYLLTGSLGTRGEALLRLRANGVLPMQCQRCMERYDHVLVLDVLFEMVAADAELTQEEVEDDSRDYLPADDEIDVLALVEDEIILSLPVAPRHEDCPVPLPRTKGGDDSPFASLVTLKQKMH